VPGEICGAFEARAALEEGRAAYRQQYFAEQRPAVRPRQWLGSPVDAHVDILAVELDVLVRGRDLHVDLPVHAMKPRQSRHQPPDRESGRQLQAQSVGGGLTCQAPGLLLDLVERRTQCCGIGGPFRRQLDAATHARAQHAADARLQLEHVTADGALRHSKFPGRAREAAMPRCRLEGTQRIERG
jgi:hypothetical protein